MYFLPIILDVYKSSNILPFTQLLLCWNYNCTLFKYNYKILDGVLQYIRDTNQKGTALLYIYYRSNNHGLKWPSSVIKKDY